MLNLVIISIVLSLFITNCTNKSGEKPWDKYKTTIDSAAHFGHNPPRTVKINDAELEEVFTFKPEEGEKAAIKYRIDEPALVSIKIVKRGTRELYLATILNYEPRDSGSHVEHWDGKDYMGKLVNMDEAGIYLTAEAYDSTDRGTYPLDKNIPPEQIIHGHKEGHAHTTYHEWAEEVPYLIVHSPIEGDTVKGLLKIRSEVDEKKRGYGDVYGYGVRYYVDNQLAHEEFYKPESNGQFMYELDTTPFSDGEHEVYVGMCDHHEHVTSVKIKVIINNRNL
jgi:hypothetical protein